MLAHLFYQMLCHGCSTAQSIYQIVLLQDCLAGWQVWLLKIYYKIFQTQKLRDMVVNGWNTWAGRVEKGCFFLFKVLLCHVLFKLPSAGTPIYSPWGPISLCLYSSTQPASHSSITRPIHPSFLPDPFIHWGQSRNRGDKIGEEIISGE